MHALPKRRFILLLSLLLSQMALAQTEPRLGVNTTTPQHTLDVNGAINIAPDSAYQIDGTPVLQTQVVNGFTNLFLGPEAGQSNTTGEANYFSGFRAGRSNTTGQENHFSGYRAGEANTTGRFNHFVGYRAGAANTTGRDNHFSGDLAGLNNITGNENYFSGYEAGRANATGSQNVYIGYRAGFDGNRTNAIAIGFGAVARGDNTVTIGDDRMTSIGGYQPWSNLSDGRFKREVAEDVPGLDFVTRLRPVSYQVDRAALQAFLKGEAVENGNTTQDQPRETGFIAQEVEDVAQELGYQFNGIIQPQSEKDHYQLSYATFVVPLVQAVQEQQELIEALQAENSHLQAKVDRLEQLESRLQVLESKSLSSSADALSQRKP